jgi:excisionase family DNA binding protein
MASDGESGSRQGDMGSGIVRIKGVYTTGEVAQICKVSQQTVIRCFDSGKLEGFRVPGSRFRRIPRESLVAFMKKNNIPLDNLDSGKKRVLVVDDDEAIVEMFVELLERDGRFEVQTANGGFNAGIMVEKHRPDLMILDYKLPDVNGNVVCQTVRSKPEFDHMRIILISGVAEPSEVQMLLDAGADEFIRKPFQIDQVINRMAELLKL